MTTTTTTTTTTTIDKRKVGGPQGFGGIGNELLSDKSPAIISDREMGL